EIPDDVDPVKSLSFPANGCCWRFLIQLNGQSSGLQQPRSHTEKESHFFGEAQSYTYALQYHSTVSCYCMAAAGSGGIFLQ
ncbi:MAG: hypothetical protein PHW35_14740, partial [Lentimicrobiaceae bacterium]|nr:hypothetical protein [Lentimicrobiaceae bacterium]